MTKTLSYTVFLFRQRAKSPLQAAFVATSADIDSWARVPTKRSGNIRNFQRAQIAQHVSEVSRFFSDENNASPTAVVVGFDPIRAAGRTKLIDLDGNKINPDEIGPASTVTARLQIEVPENADPQSSSELRESIENLREQLTVFLCGELVEMSGLSEAELRSALSEFEARTLAGLPLLAEMLEEEDGEGDEEPDEAQETEEGEASDDDLEEEGLSLAVVELLGRLSPSEKQVVIGRLEFLASLHPTMLATLPQSDLGERFREVIDEVKPALLIDGQHRVSGTKSLPDVPFLVCAIPEAEWPELAFQFIVTNRTARRVQESLLINIVGNSLSKPQRASIEDRLRQAGIRVGLIEAIMKVDEDELSPFHGLLQFGLKGERGFIDAAAMRNKVVKLWYERKAPINVMLDHFCEGKLARDRTDFWKAEEKWFEFFIAFWSAVRKRYEGSQVFSTELNDEGKPVSKLMTATVLKIFQETVLDNLLAYAKGLKTKEEKPFSQTFKTADTFGTLVENTLKPLTPEFFEGWGITGFDGSRGAKDDLTEAIGFVLSSVNTVAELKSPKRTHRLYKAPKK